jgi:hypothetical protein
MKWAFILITNYTILHPQMPHLISVPAIRYRISLISEGRIPRKRCVMHDFSRVKLFINFLTLIIVAKVEA